MTKRNLKALLLVLITMVAVSACQKGDHNHSSDQDHQHEGHDHAHSEATKGKNEVKDTHDHLDHSDHEGEHDHEEGGSLSAHVHGEAHFALAVDEKTVALELTAPADSIVGFEKNPSTEEHKKIWNDFEAKWREQNQKYITFESSLGCSKVSAKAVLEVEGEHSEVRAEAIYTCEKVPNKSKFSLNLISELPRIHKLEVEVLPNESASYVKTLNFKEGERATPQLDF